jgi:hypothetical protein
MFYGLSLELEKKGNFARRDFVPPEYDYDSPHSEGNLSQFELPDYEPQFSDLILTKQSVLTDFVGDGGAIGSAGFIVSNRVKMILSDFKLGPHRFYPLRLVSLKEKKAIEGHYFWLQIVIVDYFDWIDYKNSKFVIRNRLKKTDEDLEVNKAKDLKKLTDEFDIGSMRSIAFSKIVLNEKYEQNAYDLFYLFHVARPAIVSKKLKDRLNEEKITGLEDFKKLDIQV